MEQKDHKSEIENLQLSMVCPKYFINKYFNDLIHQLNEEMKKFYLNKINHPNDTNISFEEAENRRLLINRYIDKAHTKCIEKLSSYSIDKNLERRIQAIVEKFKTNTVIENDVIKCLTEMRKALFNEENYFILKKENANNQNSKDYFWSKIFPIIKTDCNYISQKTLSEIK